MDTLQQLFPAAYGSAIPRQDAADKVYYQITGTNVSFSTNTPRQFDEKAGEMLSQIVERHNTVEVRDDLLDKKPWEIPAGDRVFLCKDPSHWIMPSLPQPQPHPAIGEWKNHGSLLGYGIWRPGSGYTGFKRSLVYHEGNHKTNWIINIYHVIGDCYIRAGGILLCHVFESKGDYDPRPERVPTVLDFNQIALKSREEELEALLKNPKSFADYDELNENSGVYSTRITNGSNGKRSTIWKNFTEIKVLGPDGKLVLTLAICNRCNIAYKTGGLKPEWEGSTELVFQNNGTKTMKKHEKCCGQPHIAGNPQGAHQQMS